MVIFSLAFPFNSITRYKTFIFLSFTSSFELDEVLHSIITICFTFIPLSFLLLFVFLSQIIRATDQFLTSGYFFLFLSLLTFKCSFVSIAYKDSALHAMEKIYFSSKFFNSVYSL